jgi:8-oxo-dGTP pyrophosphatase MutT (NUDIX family)
MVETMWKPHTTVAAICEKEGLFLLVEEEVDNQIVYNQPAGHLEPGESLVEAVIRETLEETRYCFTPTALQGIYRYPLPGDSGQTYIRFLFRGAVC